MATAIPSPSRCWSSDDDEQVADLQHQPEEEDVAEGLALRGIHRVGEVEIPVRVDEEQCRPVGDLRHDPQRRRRDRAPRGTASGARADGAAARARRSPWRAAARCAIRRPRAPARPVPCRSMRYAAVSSARRTRCRAGAMARRSPPAKRSPSCFLQRGEHGRVLHGRCHRAAVRGPDTSQTTRLSAMPSACRAPRSSRSPREGRVPPRRGPRRPRTRGQARASSRA